MPKQPKQIEERSPEELPALAISPDKVCFVIINVRRQDLSDSGECFAIFGCAVV
jgi:hypothetical protein